MIRWRLVLGRTVSEEFLESLPCLVDGLKDIKIVQVVLASDNASVAVDDTGRLRAWGSFKFSEGEVNGNRMFDPRKDFMPKPAALSILSRRKISQVSCGLNHVLALTAGLVYSWGDGSFARLGRRVSVSVRRPLNSLIPVPLSLKDIILVSAGYTFSFAVDPEGIVYAWGLNVHGQLGIGEQPPGEPAELYSLVVLKHSIPRNMMAFVSFRLLLASSTRCFYLTMARSGVLATTSAIFNWDYATSLRLKESKNQVTSESLEDWFSELRPIFNFQAYLISAPMLGILLYSRTLGFCILREWVPVANWASMESRKLLYQQLSRAPTSPSIDQLGYPAAD
ncbi:regulator of chromosome condensation 1/beta-lactamase-inhibitor protein II [Mycena floridula]|nr:regulator of chromosome condensation 1/beta-lactamase-inhibitor protein II [Mycena floridula]